MLSGRSALASVFLCSVCLLALPRQPARKNRCTEDLIRRVDTLKKNVTDKEWLDCTLYTPSIQDAKQNCPGPSLKCFAAEMNVLTGELVESGLRYVLRLKISVGLERLATQFHQTASDCPQCEFFTEKNVTMFLEDLLVTLQMMTEQLC